MNSPEIKDLAGALLALQSELLPLIKDSENPYFKSHYASLPLILETVRPMLVRHGLALTQVYAPCNDRNHLVTKLFHVASGQSLESAVVIPEVQGSTDSKKGIITHVQAIGAATTYLRRFAITSMLGIEAEDDDGEGAEGRRKDGTAAQPQKPPYQPPPHRPTPDDPLGDGPPLSAYSDAHTPAAPPPPPPRAPAQEAAPPPDTYGGGNDDIKNVLNDLTDEIEAHPDAKGKAWSGGISLKQMRRLYTIAKEAGMKTDGEVKSAMYNLCDANDWEGDVFPAEVSAKKLKWQAYEKVCNGIEKG